MNFPTWAIFNSPASACAALNGLRQLAVAETSASILDFDQLARDAAKSSLVRLLQCAGKVEALWSVGLATTEHGWTYPRPSSQLQAVGLYHAFLGRSAVANDLTLMTKSVFAS